MQKIALPNLADVAAVSIPARGGNGTVMFQHTGAGTVICEISNDEVTYYPKKLIQPDGTEIDTGLMAANGMYYVEVVGEAFMQLRKTVGAAPCTIYANSNAG